MTKAANLAALGSVVEVPSGSAPSYQCRAWVNFNGTGTVAIRGSGNVSSITDVGAGQYTVNLTTAMPDTNYTANLSVSMLGAGNQAWGDVFSTSGSGPTAPSTSAFSIIVVNYAASAYADPSYVCVSVFR